MTIDRRRIVLIAHIQQNFHLKTFNLEIFPKSKRFGNYKVRNFIGQNKYVRKMLGPDCHWSERVVIQEMSDSWKWKWYAKNLPELPKLCAFLQLHKSRTYGR